MEPLQLFLAVAQRMREAAAAGQTLLVYRKDLAVVAGEATARHLARLQRMELLTRAGAVVVETIIRLAAQAALALSFLNTQYLAHLQLLSNPPLNG